MTDTIFTYSSTVSGTPALPSGSVPLDGDQGILATSLVSSSSGAQAVGIQAAQVNATGASTDPTSGSWPIRYPNLISADGNVVAALANADAATSADAVGLYGATTDSVIGLNVGDDTLIVEAIAGNKEPNYFDDPFEIGSQRPNTATANGAYGYLIDLGDDSDTALINAESRANTTATAVGLRSSTIDAGAGSDVVRVSADSQKESGATGSSQSFGLVDTTIRSGSGDVWLDVDAVASAWGYQSISANTTQVTSLGASQSRIELNGSDGHDAEIRSSAYLNQSLPGTASSTGIANTDISIGSTIRDQQTDIEFDNLWFYEDWEVAYTEDIRIGDERYTGLFSNRLEVSSDAGSLKASNATSIAAIGSLTTGEISSGANADFVNLGSNARAGGTSGAVAVSSTIENYRLNLQEGTDFLQGRSDATAHRAESTGISQSTIAAGEGNDLVNWSSSAGGGWPWSGNPSTDGSWGTDLIQAESSARSVAVENSVVEMGSGSDGLVLNSWSNRVEQAESSGAVNSTLDLGADLGDQLRIYANAEGRTNALAVGLQDSRLTALSPATSGGSINPPPPSNGSMGGAWNWDAVINGADLDINSWSSSRDSSLAIAALGTSETGEIVTGSANDRVRLSASAQGIWDWQSNNQGNRFVTAELASSIGAQDYSINMGDGDDDLQLSTWARGNETLAVGAVRSELELGRGDDRLQVSATTTDNVNLDPAIGLLDSNVSAGDGDDQVSINASANGRGVLESYGLLEVDHNAAVNLGSGDDHLDIWANAAGTSTRRGTIRDPEGNIIADGGGVADSVKAIGISDYDVDLGSGNNTLNVGSSASGALATSIAVRDAVITAADGIDTVLIHANTWDTPVNSEDPVVGLLGSTLTVGGGGDTVVVSANSNGFGNREAIALMGSGLASDQLDTGTGNDTVNIWANATGLDTIQTAAQNANFSSGGGQWNDTVTSTRATAFGALGYQLDLDSGNDRLDVNIWSRANETISVGFSQSSVDLGTGDDEANIWVSTADNVNYDPAIGLHQSVFSAGDGNDVLHINANSRGSGVLEAHGLLGDEGLEDTAVLDMGSGNDAININAHVNWSNNTVAMTPGPQVLSQGISHYNVNLGDGNDFSTDQYSYSDAALRANVSIDANSGNQGILQSVDLINAVVQHATIVGGTGNDWIDLHGWLSTQNDLGGADERTSIGLLATDVITGDGTDRFNLSVNNSAEGQLKTFGLVGDDIAGSLVDLGSGDDLFTTHVWASGSAGYLEPSGTTSETLGIDGYIVQTGAGADLFELSVNSTLNSRNTTVEGVINSTIDLGADDDTANISAYWNGSSHEPDAVALRNSTINLGIGNDLAIIQGHVRNSTLDGGSGSDRIEISGDYINLSVSILNQTANHYRVRYTNSTDLQTSHEFEVLNAEDVRINNQAIGTLPVSSLQLMLAANAQPAALSSGAVVRPEHQLTIESAAVEAVKRRNEGSLLSIAAPLAEAARSAVSSGMSQRIQRELRAAEDLDPFEFTPPAPPPSSGGGGGGGGALASPRDSSRDRNRRSTGDRGRSGRSSRSSRGGALSERGGRSSRSSRGGALSERGGRSSRSSRGGALSERGGRSSRSSRTSGGRGGRGGSSRRG